MIRCSGSRSRTSSRVAGRVGGEFFCTLQSWARGKRQHLGLNIMFSDIIFRRQAPNIVSSLSSYFPFLRHFSVLVIYLSQYILSLRIFPAISSSSPCHFLLHVHFKSLSRPWSFLSSPPFPVISLFFLSIVLSLSFSFSCPCPFRVLLLSRFMHSILVII